MSRVGNARVDPAALDDLLVPEVLGADHEPVGGHQPERGQQHAREPTPAGRVHAGEQERGQEHERAVEPVVVAVVHCAEASPSPR